MPSAERPRSAGRVPISRTWPAAACWPPAPCPTTGALRAWIAEADALKPIVTVQATLTAAVLVMAGFSLARWWWGRLDGLRRVTLDNTRLLWHYTTAQGLIGLAVVHGVPRFI